MRIQIATLRHLLPAVSRPRSLRLAGAAGALPLLALAALVLLPAQLQGDPAGSVTDTVETPAAVAAPGDTTGGVYTKAQAARGKTLYEVECLVCHGPREFMGTVFERRWLTPPVSGIFAHIMNTMPQDAPGSLSPEQVAGLVAYILELNGHPAGTTPLPVEMQKLAQIRIVTDSAPDSGGR
ncbi:MAG: cytochrome c [Gemmatimonadales bacterium]|nr:MAG: cytochrome c [Gemmatimonadales bacterium]